MLEGKSITDMTRSGYWEGRPRFSRDGSALLFASNRAGRRNHGSWGADADVFAMDLTQAAHDRARLSEEEFELRKPKKDDENGERKKKKKAGRGGSRPSRWSSSSTGARGARGG